MEQSDTPRTTPRTNAKERDTYSLTFGDDGDPSLYGVRQHSHHGWKLARDLERELATATRERDEARASEASALSLVSHIRQALGDNGQMMQDELIAHCRTLAGMPAEAERLRAALQEIVEDSDDEGAKECAREALAATEPKP